MKFTEWCATLKEKYPTHGRSMSSAQGNYVVAHIRDDAGKTVEVGEFDIANSKGTISLLFPSKNV